jgi:hypothetical protein
LQGRVYEVKISVRRVAIGSIDEPSI